ncbi:hypothetical protein LEP1GSC170_3326 [Leptospira interrogans serovar Bataviae str. HAI135]|nr:hypothetical protein LEP1GSC170_3326 [Leptospira interrogans serovar Bataviae str. HAI135]
MKNTEKLKYVAIVSISLLLGAFLSPVMFCGTGQNSPLFLSAKGDKEPSPATRQAITIQQAFEEVYQTASPSVVSIATEKFKTSQFIQEDLLEILSLINFLVEVKAAAVG